MNKLEFWNRAEINSKMLNQNVKLYIGDNLKVMKKLLEEGKKFDFIYFDPPYNIWRKDVLYKDNYDNWEKVITDRLVVWKDLLSDNGFLVISINDIKFNELRRILEKVFYDKKIDILKRQKFFSLKRKIPNVNPVYEYVFVVHTKDNSYDWKVLNSNGEWSYDKSIVM